MEVGQRPETPVEGARVNWAGYLSPPGRFISTREAHVEEASSSMWRAPTSERVCRRPRALRGVVK